MNHSKHQNKNNKSAKIMGIVIGILLVIAIILGLLRGCDGNQTVNHSDITDPGIVYDDNAIEGGWDEADTDKIIENLNKKVEEGSVDLWKFAKEAYIEPNVLNGKIGSNGLGVSAHKIKRYVKD